MDRFEKIAVERLATEVPGFFRLLKRDRGAAALQTSLADFPNDPLLVYMAIWFAGQHQTPLTFHPPRRPNRE